MFYDTFGHFQTWSKQASAETGTIRDVKIAAWKKPPAKKFSLQ